MEKIVDFSKLSIKKIRELIVFTALIVVALWKFDVVLGVIKAVWGIIFPFALGGAIAFVINVPMSFLEKKLFGKAKEATKKYSEAEEKEKIQNLLKTSGDGKIIQEGIRTVILGKPNAGKSSLLNLLLGEDRAIVTDIAGTTRDVLEEKVVLGNIILNLIDTAGIHETKDVVENMGVDKAVDYLSLSLIHI